MHILMISPNLPHQQGGANTRNYYLLRALAQEHTVSLLALCEAQELQQDHVIRHLRSFTHTCELVERPITTRGKRWQQLSYALRGQSFILKSHHVSEMQKRLTSLLERTAIDTVIFESMLMAGYQLPRAVRTVIDQHNLEYEILERTQQLEHHWLRRWYNQHEAQHLKPIELERCRSADLITVTSDREANILRAHLPDKPIETVPNGVDIDLFTSVASENEDDRHIVFTGAMDYYPNIQAVLFFAHQCWPRVKQQLPDVRWSIVGREPPEEIRQLGTQPDIRVTGSVPDVRTYLASASVTIAPLFIGSGTRLKILEAMASGKAMVSTSIGCEGLNAIAGQHLLVADQAESFADAVISVLQDSTLRKQLGIAGRAFVEARYSWQQCGTRLRQAFTHL